MLPIRLRRPGLLALGCLSMVAAVGAAAPSWPVVVHAELDASVPAEHDTLRVPLDTVRLEFTARVTLDATRLVLQLPGGDSVVLEARAGSDDGTIIVAAAPALRPGAHALRWRTTSADGHVLNGAIPFIVTASAATLARDTALNGRDSGAAGDAVAEPPPPPADFSAVLPLLRALGTGLLLALAGGLLFASRSADAASALRPLLTAVALAAPVAILAELVTWTAQVAGALDLGVALQLATGRALLARFVFAAFALAVWVLTRSARTAAIVAFVAVVAGGGLGHASTNSPVLSIPLRAVHMGAAAVWLGGLLALTRTLRPSAAQRPLLTAVSRAALWSFVGVAISGVAQALLLLDEPAALFATGYGRLVLAKATGLIALAAFGYQHRRMIAALPNAGDGAAIRASVARETLLFIGLIVVSAALAFTPLPE